MVFFTDKSTVVSFTPTEAMAIGALSGTKVTSLEYAIRFDNTHGAICEKNTKTCQICWDPSDTGTDPVHWNSVHIRAMGNDPKKVDFDTALSDVKPTFPSEFCSICFDAYTERNPAIKLTCGHTFHRECGETWLKKKGTCPTCRTEAHFIKEKWEVIKSGMAKVFVIWNYEKKMYLPDPSSEKYTACKCAIDQLYKNANAQIQLFQDASRTSMTSLKRKRDPEPDSGRVQRQQR